MFLALSPKRFKMIDWENKHKVAFDYGTTLSKKVFLTFSAESYLQLSLKPLKMTANLWAQRKLGKPIYFDRFIISWTNKCLMRLTISRKVASLNIFVHEALNLYHEHWTGKWNFLKNALWWSHSSKDTETRENNIIKHSVFIIFMISSLMSSQ